MKYLSIILIAVMACGTAWSQASYYPNYKSFFGKEDRIGLFSQDAKTKYSNVIRKTITANTLLIDCGSKGKPATGFILNSKEGQRLMTAAHNVQMAFENSRPCYVKRLDKPDVVIDDFQPLQNFKNSATLFDAGFDVATSDTQLASDGFNVCKSLDIKSELLVPQSYDGTGYLALSPACKSTKISSHVITTTCRGHYKASGAPLLVVKDEKVCVAGVFNAHSGSLMKYESYAARLTRHSN